MESFSKLSSCFRKYFYSSNDLRLKHLQVWTTGPYSFAKSSNSEDVQNFIIFFIFKKGFWDRCNIVLYHLKVLFYLGVEVLYFILLTIEIPDVSVKMYTKLRSNRIQCLVRKEIIHESRWSSTDGNEIKINSQQGSIVFLDV